MSQVSVRMPPKLLAIIREFARREGVGHQTLMKRWLHERVSVEARSWLRYYYRCECCAVLESGESPINMRALEREIIENYQDYDLKLDEHPRKSPIFCVGDQMNQEENPEKPNATEPATPQGHIDIVFDGPPGPISGQFVEVETDQGSISLGEWVERADGRWSLRIVDDRARIAELESALDAANRLLHEALPTIASRGAEVARLQELSDDEVTATRAAMGRQAEEIDSWRRTAEKLTAERDEASALYHAAMTSLGTSDDELREARAEVERLRC